MQNNKFNKKKAILLSIGEMALYFLVSLFVCFVASLVNFIKYDNLFLSALAMTIGWKLYYMLSNKYGWFKD